MEWITGEDILKLPGWVEFRLTDAFKNGLYPYRESDGARLTPDSLCFSCKHAPKERRYSAIGCPRNEVDHQTFDMIIKQIIKPGIPEYGGKVLKELFPDGFPKGFPANLFNNPYCNYDAEFIQFVENQVGPDNLRAMLIESRCTRREPADDMGDRLRVAIFNRADVEESECANRSTAMGRTEAGQGQQVDEPIRKFKTPKEFADHYRSIEGVKAGWIMLEIVNRFGLKKYAAAAVALGDPVPEKGTVEAKSYGGRFTYHTELIDQSE